MSETGPNTTLITNNDTSETPMQTTPGTVSQTLASATNYLADNDRIKIESISYTKRRRLVTLKRNDIFKALVDLYSHLFVMNWQYFKRLADNFKELFPPPATSSSNYIATSYPVTRADPTSTPTRTVIMEHASNMARIYISHWFVDLYRSVREACHDLSSMAFQQKYMEEMVEQSSIYDPYLIELLTHIKPTHMHGIAEESMFFPLFEIPEEAVVLANPFNIDDFALNFTYFQSIISALLDKRSGWQMLTKTTSKVGKPTWLFDWPESDQMCAWFPMEPNFTVEDVTIAYILGVACTPTLAPRDVDRRQFYAGGVRPSAPSSTRLVRALPLSKNAGYEHRKLDAERTYTKIVTNPYFAMMPEQLRTDADARRKRPRGDKAPGPLAIVPIATTTEPQDLQEQSMDIDQAESFLYPQDYYQFTDYLYYYKVIQKTDPINRLRTLYKIITDSDNA